MPRSAALRPRPGPLRRRRAPLAALLLTAFPACLCPPGVEELDAVGFRSPEQTFRTFQLAVRADAPTVEYRCLSVGFRERNQLSQLAWREFREEWFAGNPFIRRGVAKADVVAVEHPAAGLATLRAEAYGRRFELVLVREGFYQLYDGERLMADELLPPGGLGEVLAVEPGEEGGALVLAAIPLDAPELPADPTELRLGLEWKIDGIREVEDDPAPAQPRPQS